MILMISSRPSTQRRVAAQAGYTEKRGMLSAHLSKELRQQYKRRSIALVKGDEVKILNGDYAGQSGAVESVSLASMTVAVNGVKIKRTVGTEKQVPLKPSNLVVTSLNLDDKMRQKILLRKVKEVKVEPRAKKADVEAKPAEKSEAPVSADVAPTDAEPNEAPKTHAHAAKAAHEKEKKDGEQVKRE